MALATIHNPATVGHGIITVLTTKSTSSDLYRNRYKATTESVGTKLRFRASERVGYYSKSPYPVRDLLHGGQELGGDGIVSK